MTSPIATGLQADLIWRERYLEAATDRDYWRARANEWEARYVEASKRVGELSARIVEQPAEQPDQRLPQALEVALDRASTGQPKEVSRTMRREVLAAYAQAQGEEDQRVAIALRRLNDGDAHRVAVLLGEGE